MNNIKSVSERSDKIRMIIEASQKRFGLFGIEKTSMREIADDLKLSKASLYYYFTDKESLYKAVKEKEKEIIKKIFEKGISSGVFHINNIDQTTSLFLDLLKGLRSTVVSEKKTLLIEQDEYDLLLEKTIAFTDFFIKGLKFK